MEEQPASENPALTDRERELIRVYRRLDERGKRTVEMAAQAALVEVSGQDAVSSDESA